MSHLCSLIPRNTLQTKAEVRFPQISIPSCMQTEQMAVRAGSTKIVYACSIMVVQGTHENQYFYFINRGWGRGKSEEYITKAFFGKQAFCIHETLLSQWIGHDFEKQVNKVLSLLHHFPPLPPHPEVRSNTHSPIFNPPPGSTRSLYSCVLLQGHGGH